ncbi:MAG: endonuclease domain-containing protein [Terriglobia bacterium]
MQNTEKARLLRKNQTIAERTLWQKLRNRGLIQYKFRRQVPVGPYIVDFICLSARLIVEIDGGQHAVQEDYDKARDDFLRGNGYHVLRFWNNQVLENLEEVLESLTLTLSQRERELAGPCIEEK